jgi:transposase-like protein
MDQLIDIRMQQHELLMRQMVDEIHRGKLNIAQAAAKFEVSRKTVNHWLEKVEKEAEKPYQPEIIDPAAPFIPVEKTAPESLKRRPSPDQVTISKLKGQLYTLKEELKAARIKTLYYATLIQLAEQELGIDIEKKPPRPGPLPGNPMYDIRKPFNSYSTTRRVAASAVRLVSIDRAIISTGSARPGCKPTIQR